LGTVMPERHAVEDIVYPERGPDLHQLNLKIA